jgi:hypothetical protein
MLSLACTAVAQAALVAGTASLDDTEAWRLMFVSGWHTTAVDLAHQAHFIEAFGRELDVLL